MKQSSPGTETAGLVYSGWYPSDCSPDLYAEQTIMSWWHINMYEQDTLKCTMQVLADNSDTPFEHLQEENGCDDALLPVHPFRQRILELGATPPTALSRQADSSVPGPLHSNRQCLPPSCTCAGYLQEVSCMLSMTSVNADTNSRPP